MFFEPEGPALRLAPGTQVGLWRVVERLDYGAYGLVYRAQRVGPEHAGPVALKLARHAWDARFAREAELLSRIHHPSVPRLLGQGQWRLASGAEHPYLVMEWVEGVPLYEWVEQQGLISRELRGLFAQLARALAATHAAQAVHRDVKGDNMRVRRSDGRAFLLDFGSGHFQGATRLTWSCLPPGTVAYRSPAACLFYLRSVRSPEAWFDATPADDLYSLGVTLYRVATGRYPPELEPRREKGGEWYLVREELRPLLGKHPRLDPLLSEWVLRLLSLEEEERGTAEELAEALEGALAQEEPGRAAGAPAAEVASPAPAGVQVATAVPTAAAQGLESPGEPAPASRQEPAEAERAVPMAERPSGEGEGAKRAVRRAPAGAWKPWRALAAVGLCGVLVWALQAVHLSPDGLSEGGQGASVSEAPDEGAAAVGDSSPAAHLASVHPPTAGEAVAQEPLPKPHPRQTRPNEKGQCPGRKQVVLNGACWVELPPMTVEECAENGLVYYKGQCYAAPTHTPPEEPLPTSSPADSR